MFMLGNAACNNKYTATAASRRHFRVWFVVYLFCPSSSEKEIETHNNDIFFLAHFAIEKEEDSERYQS
jgi:hypothetical protein